MANAAAAAVPADAIESLTEPRETTTLWHAPGTPGTDAWHRGAVPDRISPDLVTHPDANTFRDVNEKARMNTRRNEPISESAQAARWPLPSV